MQLVETDCAALRSADFFGHWARVTPWRQFLDLIGTLHQPTNQNLIFLPPHSASSKKMLPPMSEDLYGSTHQPVELVFRNTADKVQLLQDNLTQAMYFNLELNDQDWGRSYANPNIFLPPISKPTQDINVKAILDLRTRRSQVEFLKLAISLMSNCLASLELMEALVELCRDARNRILLQNMLKQKLPTIDAFGEKLLPYAAHIADLPLVASLIEAGVYVDSEASVPNFYERVEVLKLNTSKIFFPQPALAYAIESGNERLVEYLLCNGSSALVQTESSGTDTDPYHSSYNWLLELAVAKGNLTIVNAILNPRPQFQNVSLRVSFNALYRAAKVGKPCILNSTT